ncbi:MAG: hypothetical protein JWR20_2713 [Marmoricola sp.]|nr:hypothetical protein [Marmoricola sp.]
MPVPDFILELRRGIGHDLLWLPGVTAVVRRGAGAATEVLLVRRSDDGSWTPVTGIVDPGEEPAVAAAREALEETGVVIRVDRLARVGTTDEVVYPNGDRTVYLDLTFACTWLSGQAHVADDESTDVRWCSRAELDALQPPMTAAMRERIEAGLAPEVAARFSVGGGAGAPTSGATVGEAMITRPHLHPADLTVDQARAALDDAHVHLLLLVQDGRLLGTLTRDDLADQHPGADPARPLARLEGRVVPAGAPLAPVTEEMAARGARRLAVVDDDGGLLGLLCLKRSGTGFCTDEGVAARSGDPRS